MSPSLEEVRDALRRRATREREASATRYFQAFAGGYGEGDRFLGVTVPDQRAVARAARGLADDDIVTLMCSPWHEERLVGLHLLIDGFQRGDAPRREVVVAHYVQHLRCVNNWDLVDSSAWQLLGEHLRAQDAAPSQAPAQLQRLAAATSRWERRVAIVATFAWIRAGEAGPVIDLASRLHADPDTMVLKAVGWMLREAGQRCGETVLTGFLEAHARTLGRVALRAAIEHRSPDERARWRSRRSST